MNFTGKIRKYDGFGRPAGIDQHEYRQLLRRSPELRIVDRGTVGLIAHTTLFSGASLAMTYCLKDASIDVIATNQRGFTVAVRIAKALGAQIRASDAPVDRRNLTES